MYFKKWPFSVVPDESSQVWADRTNLLHDVGSLLESAVSNEKLSVLGMWGYVGAGKSHTLLFFKNFLNKSNSYCIYSKLPKELNNFGDIYKLAFYRNINFLDFAKVTGSIYSTHIAKGETSLLEMINKKIANNWLDLAIAILKLGKAMNTEGPTGRFTVTLNAWFSGSKIPRRDLTELGLSSNITSDSDFVKAASAIIRTLTFSDELYQGYNTACFMLDDCHYFAEIRKRKSFSRVQQGLRDLIDSCSTKFCIIFAFASRDSSVIDELLIEDLQSRMQEKIKVAPLSRDDALDFIRDLMINPLYRSSDDKDEYYPLTKQSATEFVDLLASTTDIIPRTILKGLDAIVSKAQSEIAPKPIGPEYIEQHFEACKGLLKALYE